MVVLQVFQAKLDGTWLAAFCDLHSVTDLALGATKTTAQAKSMASLIVLERHLWLNLMEIKDVDRTALFDSPVSPTGFFGSAVDGFTERFTKAQKSLQAMHHFLPKCYSSAASSRLKTMLSQQPVKPAPVIAQPEPALEPRQHPTPCFPPRHQGPQPKITLDPMPQKLSWSTEKEEGRVRSHCSRTALQKGLCFPPNTLFSSSSWRKFFAVSGPVRVHAPMQLTAVIVNKIQHKNSQKKSTFPLPNTTAVCPLHQSGGLSPEVIQPLATQAEAWEAIPDMSEWVLKTIK